MAGFRQFLDLDSTTTFCPCGASIKANGWTSDATMDVWLAEHIPHTDTKVMEHHVTDDGMRCLSDDSKRNWTTER